MVQDETEKADKRSGTPNPQYYPRREEPQAEPWDARGRKMVTLNGIGQRTVLTPEYAEVFKSGWGGSHKADRDEIRRVVEAAQTSPSRATQVLARRYGALAERRLTPQ